MSTPKKLAKMAQKLIQQILQLSRTITKKLMNWLLRGLFVLGRSSRLSQVGFVLPTVVMVILVVTLLVTAIMIRSFDRSKNISNYRVNQEVLNAALPALDRAKAKIEALLADPNLPRGTPSDISINTVLGKAKYTLGGEERLKLKYDTAESSNAWRFPVDTDNNGAYDSFTLYSILFNTPPVDAAGNYNRARNPLEARGLPMASGRVSGACANAVGSATLIGSSGWYQIGSELKKSFFVYVTTVPITDLSILPTATGYETYKGNKGFSALEYQQDQAKTPIANNAVLYEDDLDISAGGQLTLNGRIFTNSNLFITEFSNPLTFRQVSSRNSCFYEPGNASIVVGGNLGYGRVTGDTNTNIADIDLFKGTKDSNDPGTATLASGQASVTNTPANMSYNTLAYENRIKKLVELAVAGTSDPDEVTRNVNDRLAGSNPPTAEEARRQELENYMRARTRRVPFIEVPYTPPPTPGEDLSGVTLQGSGNTLRPPDAWMYPFAPTDGKTGTGYSQMSLNISGKALQPPATEFETQEETGIETSLGDRVLVGNNLPAIWRDSSGAFVGKDAVQPITGIDWDVVGSGANPRKRKTRVEQISDLGDIGRDRFWETKAAESPANPLDAVGGLRVVTGAGVYLPNLAAGETLAANASKVVWPDYMPVVNPPAAAYPPGLIDLAAKKRPHLQMRATAVYHHRNGDAPIACVSSYYDPTTTITARNKTGLADVSGDTTISLPAGATGNSNNGITYPPPTAASPAADLAYQASLVYPNGRPVNPMLREALAVASGTDLTLAQQAAIDSTSCALQILAGTLTASTTPTAGYNLPDGTIKEVAFLDARQTKAIDGEFKDHDTNPATLPITDYKLTGKYDLDILQRQPLEVRATVLDLTKLRTSTADGSNAPQEYMLPNSGIIYATRDDALPDASDSALPDKSNSDTKIAATDFLLDPTRRPNGIMLINGSNLWRRTTFEEVEKGLILASNLPVYIKGEFNPHKNSVGEVQEFTALVEPATTKDTYYGRNTPNSNFACRKDDPRLPTGACADADTWRPATVLSDAVTLLSSNFREGFRNEGDYDLRNNQTDNIANPDTTNDTGGVTNEIRNAATIEQERLKQGFWNNNFVTNGLSSGLPVTLPTGSPLTAPPYTDAMYGGSTNKPLNSSYFNNFVTPVQRRTNFREYLMEVCKKKVVSECTSADWFINPDSSPPLKATKTDLLGATNPKNTYNINTHTAGTTAELAKDTLQGFPRRVAFLRDATNNLLLRDGKPLPLVILNSTKIGCYRYTSTEADTDCPVWDSSEILKGGTNTSRARTNSNALWFRTTNNSADPFTIADYRIRPDRPLAYANGNPGNAAPPNPIIPALPSLAADNHPLLLPVVQLQVTQTQSSNSDDATLPVSFQVNKTQWLPKASGDTIFNLAMATGDNPSRPYVSTADQGNYNGGLANLPRFLENWIIDPDANTRFATKISGSFIQIKRSAYATGPFAQTLIPTGTGDYPTSAAAAIKGIFNSPQVYNTGNEKGRTPYYEAPGRVWGFDVGLLSQLPDLFSQQFTIPPTKKPAEFFREVSRDDEWVQTLLCAKTFNPTTGTTTGKAINNDQRPTTFCTSKTGG